MICPTCKAGSPDKPGTVASGIFCQGCGTKLIHEEPVQLTGPEALLAGNLATVQQAHEALLSDHEELRASHARLLGWYSELKDEHQKLREEHAVLLTRIPEPPPAEQEGASTANV